ncbi:plant intracellular Ras-group-related LRR protein 4-like isoform X2 [Impatiens glandulifera]|uniref:plant intracellular Ras-group-related LRR protein 4-like isoform X2 n=1 Tax=Impatiens glandulifera TaxID=253017 RepID=UPI001FB0DFF3|nr:plant intracellular Ras-group-related LRR protein 4-like isoform X2 [Impatiens glandulifera]
MDYLFLKSTNEVVQEIMRIHRSLPPRPGIEEVEAAKTLIRNVDNEDQARLESISKQKKGVEIAEELFMILLELQKNWVYFQSREQKRDAIKVLDFENAHQLFDEMIQRASNCISPESASDSSTSLVSSNRLSLTNSASFSAGSINSPAAITISNSALFYENAPPRKVELVSRDDTYLKPSKPSFYGSKIQPADVPPPQIVDSSLRATSFSGQDGEKLSLIKLASLIEVSSKKGIRELNLQNKLMDQIEWLPDSVGKLSSLITFNLSENRLLVLPATIGGLLSLKKLDLHSNRISELPGSFFDLINLISLDLRGNQLSSLPQTIGRLVNLEELDLSSNRISSLPETIGALTNLKILNIETNNIEEIPHAIGQCLSLKELLADYNRLKALPEAVGRIGSLEILSVRYNNVRQLPTTMSSLSSLKELNVSFNELESVPESLCFATTLVKINVSNNFADLRSLPRSIGNLEMLEDLDVSNNQIRFLPESFRMLSQLRRLNVEGNPLELPPMEIAGKGCCSVYG